MAIDASMEPMLDMFIFETTTLLEQLDAIILEAEKAKTFSEDNVAEIFRIMHTIKGSSAMMGLDAVSHLAHSVEDMFFIIREDQNHDHLSQSGDIIFDLVLQCSDYLKSEVENITGVGYEASSSEELTSKLKHQIAVMKGEAAAPVVEAKKEIKEEAAPAPKKETKKKAAVKKEPKTENGGWIRVLFDDGLQMENIRAFMLITQLKECCEKLDSIPDHPETNPGCAESIAENGLLLHFEPLAVAEELAEMLKTAINIKSYEFLDEPPVEAPAAPVEEEEEVVEETVEEVKKEEPVKEVKQEVAVAKPTQEAPKQAAPKQNAGGGKQSLISVNQSKLDQLMDIVSELVIAESMVASNPDLKGLQLDNFNKSVRELRKLTDELQDVSMSMRMVTLNLLFQKMNRIVRDMSKKLGKKVELVTVGDETEIDKTINDLIQDPFMHMVRNAVDHAIEMPEERIAKGKPETGTVTLSAQNIGGEIVIGISDDGTGLDPKVILDKARSKGLINKPDSEYSNKDIYNMIMLPGFSTNTEVTEYSGRGVGMDVVRKNIEKAGGSLSIESHLGEGTTFWIKIPLTLAIVDGMEFMVGDTIFTLPITSITQSFKLSEDTKVFYDTDGTEMIMVRNECFPIIRLHQRFNIESRHTELADGILILIEAQDKKACLFADELIGEQQIVVKPFPKYLSRFDIKRSGLSGCTILGDGGISLILDANGLMEKN